MEFATIMLALGGDQGNTITKFEVTPSEAEVLRQIHGNEAVFDIQIAGDIKRTHRAERERLLNTYGKPDPSGAVRSPVIDSLFPGVAARLFETFAETEIDEEFYRAPPKRDEPEPVIDDTLGDLNKLKKAELLRLAEERGVEVSENNTKAEIIAAIEAKAEDDDDGGIGDMPGAGASPTGDIFN